MSIGQALARLVGIGVMGLAGWLWYQGQPLLIVVIVAAVGAAFFLSGGLSR